MYKIQAAFHRSGKLIEGNLTLLTLGSPMTSQVSSKSKSLTIWRIWFCRPLQPYRMEISQYNNIDRVWDTSKCHPKTSVTIFKAKVIQGHEVDERSNRKFYVWVPRYMFLSQFFVKNAKSDPTTAFEQPKSDKI